MTLSFRTCDVFTDTRYGGNPLAVVGEADGLSAAAMQVMAAEFNLSETVFVMEPPDAAHDAAIRIFTPRSEMAFAGHPVIGTAILLAEDAEPEAGDFERTITLKVPAGTVPVRVTRADGRIEAVLTAPIVPFMVRMPVPEADAAAALGLDRADVDLAGHCPGVAEGGPRFVFVPVRSLDALGRAAPKQKAFDALCDRCGTDMLYAYAPGADGADYRARMFAPGDGIAEDPATGSATVCLAAHLDSCDMLDDGTSDLVLHQGVEMGRPSVLRLGIDRADGALTAVRVGGSAVRVSEGQVVPPEA